MFFEWIVNSPVAWFPVLGMLGVVCDLAFGDPRLLPHPVRFQGWMANFLEPLLRRASLGLGGGDGSLRLVGGLGVVLLALTSGAVAFGLARLPGFGPLFALYLLFAGLAMGSLLSEGKRVFKLLFVQRDLLAARAGLGMLVTRETASLDQQGVARGLAETVSENANDGFVAPCFYFVLGSVLGRSPEWGVAALWAYKAVSTLDSMWGYRTGPWRAFGWAAARTDDVLAWLPARFTALAMLAVTIPRLGVGWSGFRPMLAKTARDAVKTSSPNAGWPMAAAAWSCGAWLGGPATYFGQRMDKPLLGPEEGEWDERRMARLFRMTREACLLAAGVLILVGALALWL